MADAEKLPEKKKGMRFWETNRSPTAIRPTRRVLKPMLAAPCRGTNHQQIKRRLAPVTADAPRESIRNSTTRGKRFALVVHADAGRLFGRKSRTNYEHAGRGAAPLPREHRKVIFDQWSSFLVEAEMAKHRVRPKDVRNRERK